MEFCDPLSKSKNDYESTIARIKSDSTVGIDAQYTHAIIIEYLQQLTKRVERIEESLRSR